MTKAPTKKHATEELPPEPEEEVEEPEPEEEEGPVEPTEEEAEVAPRNLVQQLYTAVCFPAPVGAVYSVLKTDTGTIVPSNDPAYMTWLAVPNTLGPIPSVARPPGS